MRQRKQLTVDRTSLWEEYHHFWHKTYIRYCNAQKVLLDPRKQISVYFDNIRGTLRDWMEQ